MRRLLLLIPSLLYAAAPKESRKYTIEQLKALKPPLTAQLHNALPKAPYVKDPFSPTPKPKKLVKYLPVPHNSPEVTTPKPALPVEEIVLVFEKVDK